jgi:predicted P-loop ATPase
VVEGQEAWRGRLALDVTTGEILLDATVVDDARFFMLQESVTRFCQWMPNSSRQWWTDVLRSVASKNPINPREAWLRSLRWDGTPRLDTWLNERVAALSDEVNSQIGRKWLISLVARWIQPGCKVDTVLILVGAEGVRKNTFFEIIAGGAERIVDLEGFDRDNKYIMARAWLVEMPEAHLLRRADNNRLKGFITKPTDDYRIPYASAPVTIRRGFVFVSTANPGSLFQVGQDGLRRYWPVEVRAGKIDYKWVAANREQMLAEAVVAYDLEEPWWFEETPAALKDRVAASVEDSVVDEAIERIVAQRVGKGGMGLNEICSEVTAIVGFRASDRLISALLPRHGCMKKRSATERFWMHPSWTVKEDNVVAFPVDNQTLSK